MCMRDRPTTLARQNRPRQRGGGQTRNKLSSSLVTAHNHPSTTHIPQPPRDRARGSPQRSAPASMHVPLLPDQRVGDPIPYSAARLAALTFAVVWPSSAHVYHFTFYNHFGIKLRAREGQILGEFVIFGVTVPVRVY